MRVSFGQGHLVEAFVRQRKSKDGWLDDIDRLLDWPRLAALFSDIYASREGGASYPISTCAKLLLLQQWHRLSDPALEAAVDDRLSFRRFCGMPLDRPIGCRKTVRIMRRSGAFGRSLSRKAPTA